MLGELKKKGQRVEEKCRGLKKEGQSSIKYKKKVNEQKKQRKRTKTKKKKLKDENKDKVQQLK